MSRLRLHVLEAGSCVHPEHVVLRNGQLRPLRFPALFAVLAHPTEGLCLFDTGYSRAFIEATRSLPERLYAWVTPVTIRPEQSAARQLAQLGYAPSDVRSIFISHFHADHVSGLSDFPRATFRYLRDAFTAVRSLGRLSALRRGVLPRLLPPDFEQRSKPIHQVHTTALPASCAPFREGVDLFGDRSCFAVELPGHARGQLGLFVRHLDDRLYFFVADACWTRAGFAQLTRPHPLTYLLFDDRRRYDQTRKDIHDLARRERELTVVPSHCQQTLELLRSRGLG